MMPIYERVEREMRAAMRGLWIDPEPVPRGNGWLTSNVRETSLISLKPT